MEEHLADAQSQQIIDLWNEIHKNTNDYKMAAKYIQNAEIYNQIARQNNQIIIISNFKKHQFLTISDNFDDIYEYGCSMQDCIKWGFFYFTRSISWEQIKVMFKVSNWYRKLKMEPNPTPYFLQTYSGWKFKSRKTGKIKYLFTKAVGLEFSKNGEPLIVMTTVSDISHLLKTNPPFWGTISFDSTNKMSYLFHNQKDGITQSDLLCPVKWNLLVLLKAVKN